MIKKVLQEYNKDKKEYISNVNKEKNIINKIKLMIPNILTKSRILAPFILIPCTLTGNFVLTTIIASLLGLTDCVDGYLARKWNASTKYGQKLDAISDKLFAIGISIPLLITNPLLISSTLIFESLIGIVNFKSFFKGNEPKSTHLGKFKTIVLYIFLSSFYLTKALNIPFMPIEIIGLTNILQIATLTQYHKIDKQKDAQKTNENIIKNNDNNDPSISPIRKQIYEYQYLKETILKKEEIEEEKVLTKTPKN